MFIAAPSARRRAGQLALALLISFFLAWDLAAILRDQRLAPTDSTYGEATTLAQELPPGSDWLEELGRRMGECRKGPLAGIAVLLLDVFVGDMVLAARLLGVLLHGASLWLVAALAGRLTLRPAIGLVAALVLGVFPGSYGLFRSEFHEPLIATAILWVLWLLAGELQTVRRAVHLGLAVAAGILSKVGFVIFLLGPGAWFLATRVRTRRAALNLCVAGAVAAVAVSCWLIPSLPLLRQYVDGASFALDERDHGALHVLAKPGTLPLFGAALAGLLLGLRRRLLGRDAAALLATSTFVAPVLLLWLFHPWYRYIMPAFGPAALLAAVGLVAAGEAVASRVSGRALGLLAAAGATALLGMFVAHNITGIEDGEARELGLGIVTPDTRGHDSYPRMARELQARGARATYVPAIDFQSELPARLPGIWQRRGHELPLATVAEARARLEQGQIAYFVLAEHRPFGDADEELAAPGATPGLKLPAEYADLLGPHQLETVIELRDPDRLRLRLLAARRRGKEALPAQ